MLVSSFPYTRQGPFYSVCRDRILLFWLSTTFVWFGCTCRPPLVRLCATPYRQTKENYFVCLSVCCGTLSYYSLGAFSLSIPHGLHLVVPTQFCFFWVVCRPSRTLPSKEPEQEPRNRYFPSFHRQTMPFYL